MMFKRRFHDLIARGEITSTVRIWKRPHVKVGGRYRVADGEIEVTRISEIGLEGITPTVARRSGFSSVPELLKVARHGAGERVFLVEFRYLGKRAADELPYRPELDEAAAEDVNKRLDAMDRRSANGPWTREVLQLILNHPGLRAGDLADQLGLPKDDFKRDVRKLKKLGLTLSLETGYELSPRGRALLQRR